MFEVTSFPLYMAGVLIGMLGGTIGVYVWRYFEGNQDALFSSSAGHYFACTRKNVTSVPLVTLLYAMKSDSATVADVDVDFVVFRTPLRRPDARMWRDQGLYILVSAKADSSFTPSDLARRAKESLNS